MPRYDVECVDRDTGRTAHHVFDAADAAEAVAIANRAGFIAGAARPSTHERDAKPRSTFRPTFKTHLTPRVARLTAVSAVVVAFAGPASVVASLAPFHNLGDQRAWLVAWVAGAISLIPFGFLALWIRVIAELASILFDIFRLVREIHATFHR